MMQKILLLIPFIIIATLLLIPFWCIVLYKRRKLRTCIVFSHVWCMIAFCLLGMFIVHTARRHQERFQYAEKARVLLEISKMLREGDAQKSIMHLDDYLAETLYRTAYDISDDKMGEQDPGILWLWQEVKEYYVTYQVKEPFLGGMIPHVRRKLSHVPWSNMQLAIKKFEQTYQGGKHALAPAINMESWISPPLTNNDLKNKVILLDFWNTHCHPCIKSFPELQKIHDTYKARGLVVITCAGGDKKETSKFLKKHEYSFPAGMVSNQMWLDYAIRGNPAYFLIDRGGYLVWGPEYRLPTDDELIHQLGVVFILRSPYAESLRQR
ncbi:MAG: TlpA disulfide reductase family protein [Phycisphaerae bacterium]